MAAEIILPIVHLNGTSRERLIEDRIAMMDAARTLANTLREYSPNPRDYYPKPGLFEQAVAQHQARIDSVREILTALETEIERLDA